MDASVVQLKQRNGCDGSRIETCACACVCGRWLVVFGEKVQLLQSGGPRLGVCDERRVVRELYTPVMSVAAAANASVSNVD